MINSKQPILFQTNLLKYQENLKMLKYLLIN